MRTHLLCVQFPCSGHEFHFKHASVKKLAHATKQAWKTSVSTKRNFHGPRMELRVL